MNCMLVSIPRISSALNLFVFLNELLILYRRSLQFKSTTFSKDLLAYFIL